MIETAVVGLLDAHIARLHEYNQVKDIGQMLFGQVAERRGSTTREVYELFDMELTD